MKKLILLSLIAVILVGCGTSNSVVNDGFFQKRKHRSGWFVKKKKGVEKKSANEENLAFNEQDERSSKAEHPTQSKESSNTIKQTDVENESITIAKTSKRNTITPKQNRKVATKSKQIVHNNSVKEAPMKSNTTTERFVTKESLTSTSDQRKKQSSSSSSDLEIILLVLLALIIPPLAVYLVQDTSTMFVVDLILFIIGWGSFWFFNLGGLAALAAVVIALLVVFGVL